jgi:hypothetical protein
MKKWDMIHTELHYACALLNPFLINVVEIQNNRNAKRTQNMVVEN